MANQVDARGHNVAVLEQQAPTAPQTFLYKSLWLANLERFDEATVALSNAVDLGFPQKAADDFAERMGIAEHGRRWRYAKWGAVVLAVWLSGLAILFLAGWLLSHKALRAVENAAGNTELLDRTTRSFRSIYGWLIGAGAVAGNRGCDLGVVNA